jgi:nitrogenase iron protein NifH
LQQIAIYGKGGIGKSVVATNLSAHFGIQGRRVLHVGCDPKCDSALRLMNGSRVATVMDLASADPDAISIAAIINRGRHNVDCVEAGGPEPGTGCAGRGVARTIELLGEHAVLENGAYDVAVFDVLGDVVCGGFAAPLRLGFARKVVIVVSDQPMSLFAANNITRAVRRYGPNGVALTGIVANMRTADSDSDLVRRFAARLGTRILAFLDRNQTVVEAEKKRRTVIEWAPESPLASTLRSLGEEILAFDADSAPVPSTMTDDEFFAFLAEERS